MSTYGYDISCIGASEPSTAESFLRRGTFMSPTSASPTTMGAQNSRRRIRTTIPPVPRRGVPDLHTHDSVAEAIDWGARRHRERDEVNSTGPAPPDNPHLLPNLRRLIDRCKRLGVMANVQSTFLHFEGDTYVGFPRRERGAQPLKTFVEKGIPVAAAMITHRGRFPQDWSLRLQW